ncbi:MAG TPA: hypothetical protein VKS22_06320 [Candidatus Binataceae bacterium]|nr:hypothetical protein [Candidatus Binataceae bacterium]
MAAATLFTIPSFTVPGASNSLRVGTSTQNVWEEPALSEGIIESLEDGGYVLLQPIRFQYKRAGFGYIASFDEANIAISGITKQDARQALEIEILDAFDDWIADETALGAELKKQLVVLKKHVRRC